MAEPRLIITGGGGLLGTALRPLLPDADFPSSAEFDVRDFEQMHAYAQRRGCNLILHAAAFTSPPIVDKDPIHAIDVNIVGTANVVRLCARLDAHLFYLSTDYVFKGDQGPYQEDDPLHPVNNYAWSKLGGECAARLWHKSLIIRTSFGPDVFPFPKAFVDQWTSREPVSTVARKITRLLQSPPTGILHIGGPRRTVLDYARSLDGAATIGEISVNDVSFPIPVDTSLDTRRYESLTSRNKEPS